MLLGMPVAISFLIADVLGAYFLWGGTAGFSQLILSIRDSITSFNLLPVPLFILMGEVMFQSGVAPRMMRTVDMWLGRLPGRLGLVAVAGGTIFSTLSGSSMASVAMLGSVLTPEMEKAGYHKSMSIGPILGSGGLAVLIPPSTLAVLIGSLGEISIGKILIGSIFPGLLLAVLCAAYIVIRCWLQPSIAPPYDVPPVPFKYKVIATLRYILPLSLVVFLVIGLIFAGVATPSEAAATGTVGSVILALFYRGFTWQVIKKSFTGAISISVMMFAIIAGAIAFSQVLAFMGTTKGLVNFATGLNVAPIIIIIAMQVVVFLMGMFMSVFAIMMITLPIFMPIVFASDFSPVWFAVIYLVNCELAAVTPPYGVNLFVMKGVAPKGTTMEDVIKAAVPFIFLNFLVIVLIFIFPQIALWLPGLMMKPTS